MKKLCLIALSLVPTVANAGAAEDLRMYLRADAGFTYSDLVVDNYDLGGFQGLFNFAIGAQKESWRLDLSYQERATVSEMFSSLLTQTMASVEQHAFMLNAYYDVLSSKYFAWYFGAGTGLSAYEKLITYQNTNMEKSESGLGATFGAYTGVSINFEHIGIDFGLDYYYTYKLHQNSFVPKVGLRIKF